MRTNIEGALVLSIFLLALGCCEEQQPVPCQPQPCVPAAADGAAEEPPPARAFAPDFKKIAAHVVNDVVRAKKGDAVVIRAAVRDMELVDEIQVECWKKGAATIPVVINQQLDRRYFDEVSAEMDSLPAETAMKLTGIETVEIVIAGVEDPDILKDVPGERLSALARRAEPVDKLRTDRSVRTAILYNGLYPTAAQAKQLGITVAQLEQIFWGSLAGDSSALAAIGESVRAALLRGKEVHITNPNGTDLKVGVIGREIFVNDGVISDADLEAGGGAVMKFLPAGEVYFAPVKGTAAGKIVVDRFPFEDGEITKLTATIEAGKITSMTGEPAELLERFEKQMAAVGERANELSIVDFGINPDVVFPSGVTPLSFIPGGMVTLLPGGNLFAGGDNPTVMNWNWFVPGSTVTVDGEVLIDKGVLKAPKR